MNSGKKWYGVFIFLGSLLWIIAGVIMSLREPGNHQGEYRKTFDLMPVLGLGMLFITFSLAHLLWSYTHRKSTFLVVACSVDVLAGIVFLTGGIMVANNPIPFPFLLFSGYVVSILGLILSGVAGYKKKMFSPTITYSIISIGACLLFFNDQYTPWVAIILGGIACWLSYLFFFRLRHFSSKSIHQ